MPGPDQVSPCVLDVSVNAVVVAERRPYGAYQDPSLPTGAWVARQQLAGDVSGGTATITIVFADATQLRTNELFSLEQLSVSIISAGTETDALLRTLNLDKDLAGKGNNQAAQDFAIQMRNMSGLIESAIDMESAAAVKGLFLGRQVDATTVTGIATIWNNVNGGTHITRCQGYVWGPRSVSTPTGPRRPISGLYMP